MNSAVVLAVLATMCDQQAKYVEETILVFFQVNFSAFNSTYEVDTPLCSSKDLQKHYRDLKKYQRALSHQHPKDSPHILTGAKGFRPSKAPLHAPLPTFRIEDPSSTEASASESENESSEP